MLRHFGVFSILLVSAWAVSIDNDIIGEPDIECLDEEIRVHVKTRKIFAGRIYAKGRAEIEECSKSDFDKEKTTKPRFDLRFGVCGMKSMRSVDPRGMYYGITVVVSFHPEFITKVDQAFHVKCFFEEASKGLTAELGVSVLPVNELEARHGIPGCSYTVHRSSIEELDAGRPAGPPIRNARVGDRVLHQWHCNDKMFGILINNCYVTDGFGKKADVIDAHGCPVDPLLITGIRYSTDLQRAYAESQVFKFADKPGVWFFCQVQMCMKKAGMCKNISPPPCAMKGAAGAAPDANEIVEVAEGDYEYSTAPQPIVSTTSDYGDYSDTSELKLHSPDSPSYQRVTPAVDYEMRTEPVTVFGPAFNMDSTIFPVTQTSERVSQSFETEDDLKTTTPSKPGKNDYNDYDEVTIPPNLTDLLANLPDDLNADSLQRMFRDSVDDRKALLEGFELLKRQMKSNRKSSRILRELRPGDLRSGDKITQIQTEWSTKRRRDVPSSNENEEKPMIAGQLLIFDLDEERPLQEEKKEEGCAISRGGLFAVAGGLGAICATFFSISLVFYIRLNRNKVFSSDDVKYGHY